MSRLPGIDFKFSSAWTPTRPCGSLSIFRQHQIFMLIAANRTIKEIRENHNGQDDFAAVRFENAGRPGGRLPTSRESMFRDPVTPYPLREIGTRKHGQSGPGSASGVEDLIYRQKSRPRTDLTARPNERVDGVSSSVIEGFSRGEYQRDRGLKSTVRLVA